MFEFSVVIAVYNRRESLYLTLCALDKTLLHYQQPVEIVVVDDGSTDNPLEVMFEFQDKFALQYRWQPHNGFQEALAINRGCAIARGHNFLITDADILLTPESLAHLANIIRANPGIIVAGRYDWMLPMKIRPYDIYYNWDKIVDGTLPPAQFGGNPKGFIGVDPRHISDPHLFDGDRLHTQFAAILFAGVLMFPRAQYTALGGFDEQMVGHGGQDCELSIRAQQADYHVIFSGLVHGFHMYHDRDQVANQTACNRNVQYIAKKHNLEDVGLYMWHVGNVMGIARAGEKLP